MTCSPAFSRRLGDFITSNGLISLPRSRFWHAKRRHFAHISQPLLLFLLRSRTFQLGGLLSLSVLTLTIISLHEIPMACTNIPRQLKHQRCHRNANRKPSAMRCALRQAVLLAPDRSAIMALIEDRRRTFVDHEQSECPLPGYARNPPLKDHSLHSMQTNGGPILIPSLERLDCCLATCWLSGASRRNLGPCQVHDPALVVLSIGKKGYMWMSLLRHMLPSTTVSAIPFQELFLPHPLCL